MPVQTRHGHATLSDQGPPRPIHHAPENWTQRTAAGATARRLSRVGRGLCAGRSLLEGRAEDTGTAFRASFRAKRLEIKGVT